MFVVNISNMVRKGVIEQVKITLMEFINCNKTVNEQVFEQAYKTRGKITTIEINKLKVEIKKMESKINQDTKQFEKDLKKDTDTKYEKLKQNMKKMETKMHQDMKRYEIEMKKLNESFESHFKILNNSNCERLTDHNPPS